MRATQKQVPRGLVAGLGAGLLAMGCCAGPAVAALMGLVSAAVAVDVATELYGRWGWAFKLAGAGLGAAAVLLARRRTASCEAGSRRSAGKFAAVLVASGVTTYAVVYAATTSLASLDRASSPRSRQATRPAEPAPISALGSTTARRIDVAIERVERLYPHFEVIASSFSATSVRVQVGWEVPQDVHPVTRHDAEIARRVGDLREATVLLLQIVATSNPRVRWLSAYEDRLLVPTWSRRQIVSAGPPSAYRGFGAFSSFQFSAASLGGYASLSEP